jgi:hypothetical protein
LLYTDGVLETWRSQPQRTAPLAQLCAGAPQLTVADLLTRLERAVVANSAGIDRVETVMFAAPGESRQRAQKFAVTPGSQQVKRLLSVTRLNEHLETIATPDEVLG